VTQFFVLLSSVMYNYSIAQSWTNVSPSEIILLTISATFPTWQPPRQLQATIKNSLLPQSTKCSMPLSAIVSGQYFSTKICYSTVLSQIAMAPCATSVTGVCGLSLLLLRDTRPPSGPHDAHQHYEHQCIAVQTFPFWID